MKTNTIIDVTKLTAKEKAELLEKLEAERGVDTAMSDLVKELIDTVKNKIKWLLGGVRIVGTEAEQARNDSGEPLFVVDGLWRKYTQAKIDAVDTEELKAIAVDGKVPETKIHPYYRNITEDYTKTIDELDSWDKPQYIAYARVLDMLNATFEGWCADDGEK